MQVEVKRRPAAIHCFHCNWPPERKPRKGSGRCPSCGDLVCEDLSALPLSQGRRLLAECPHLDMVARHDEALSQAGAGLLPGRDRRCAPYGGPRRRHHSLSRLWLSPSAWRPTVTDSGGVQPLCRPAPGRGLVRSAEAKRARDHCHGGGLSMGMIRYLSLGWGVQSWTIAAIVALRQLPPIDVAVHADTGHEAKGTYEHARIWTPWLEERGVKVVTVHPDNIDVTRFWTNGMPSVMVPAFTKLTSGAREGQMKRQCTSYWKVRPLRRYIRDLLRTPRPATGRSRMAGWGSRSMSSTGCAPATCSTSPTSIPWSDPSLEIPCDGGVCFVRPHFCEVRGVHLTGCTLGVYTRSILARGGDKGNG